MRWRTKGYPAKALGWTLFAAATGGIVSTLAAVALVHPFATFALKFDSPEYFTIILFGLTSIVALGGGSIINAFISLFLGLMIATVGVDGIYGVERFTFGVPMLADGIEYLTVMVGAYGLGEVLIRLEKGVRDSADRNRRQGLHAIPDIARSLGDQADARTQLCSRHPHGDHSGSPARRSRRSFRTASKPSIASGRSELGSGIAEGIVAPQTASTATVAGHMVPLLTLGIPGSGATAIILGAFLLHGVQPGPQLFTKDPALVYAIFAALLAGVSRHVPDGLFRDQAADQGALPARDRHLRVRRAVLLHRRVLRAQQHHRPVDDRGLRHRRLPVREVQVPDRADGAGLHPRRTGRERVHDQHDQLSRTTGRFSSRGRSAAP
jgi:putative tricarboxylic transport membrane protein